PPQAGRAPPALGRLSPRASIRADRKFAPTISIAARYLSHTTCPADASTRAGARPDRALGAKEDAARRRRGARTVQQLTSTELRTLVAAQIASGLVGHVAPNAPQTTIDEGSAARC